MVLGRRAYHATLTGCVWGALLAGAFTTSCKASPPPPVVEAPKAARDESPAILKLIDEGRADEASARALLAESQGGLDDGARLRVGRAFLSKGEAKKAAPVLKRVRAQLSTEETLVLAEVFAVTGDAGTAAQCFEDALNRGAKRSAGLLSRYAEVLAAQGETDKAVQALRESLALDPTSTRTLLHLATALVNLRRIDEAKEEAHKILKQDPKNREAASLLDGLRKAETRGASGGTKK